MSEDIYHVNEASDNQIASDGSLTRKEFLTRVVRGAVATGALLAGPRILDKFLVPPAYAGTSTGCGTSDLPSAPTTLFFDRNTINPTDAINLRTHQTVCDND
jgi:hypothetical protein